MVGHVQDEQGQDDGHQSAGRMRIGGEAQPEPAQPEEKKGALSYPLQEEKKGQHL